MSGYDAAGPGRTRRLRTAMRYLERGIPPGVAGEILGSVQHEPTLGELEERGLISGGDAWGAALGPEWRSSTARQAQEIVRDHDLAAAGERWTIVAALVGKFEQGRVLTDAVVCEAVRELYGERPPAAAVAAAVATLANIERHRRGERAQ